MWRLLCGAPVKAEARQPRPLQRRHPADDFDVTSAKGRVRAYIRAYHAHNCSAQQPGVGSSGSCLLIQKHLKHHRRRSTNLFAHSDGWSQCAK